MKNVYRANGKLLLTGEYAIMFGAIGLAIPLNRFQEMHVDKKKEVKPYLYWKAYDINGLWFEAKWKLPNFEIESTTDISKANFIIQILQHIRLESPFFLNDSFSYVTTHFCNFNINWGLGSSSTLMVNLSQWAEIDPFRLYFQLFKGSGYDIACATVNTPILYSLENFRPKIEPINYFPPFIDQLYLVYSGSKQNTQEAIKTLQSFSESTLKQISQITYNFIKATNIKELNDVIREHEIIVAKELGLQPIKDTLFPTFPGQIKSLGAWGGDFWLVVSPLENNEIVSYFSGRGFTTIIPLKELMLCKQKN
ncbi:MAG: GYDIA family GHMP kinase [Bacteroidales bacterium]|nr:GYDIA family GHMP kinase [Bacteroidales bacterium]